MKMMNWGFSTNSFMIALSRLLELSHGTWSQRQSGKISSARIRLSISIEGTSPEMIL